MKNPKQMELDPASLECNGDCAVYFIKSYSEPLGTESLITTKMEWIQPTDSFLIFENLSSKGKDVFEAEQSIHKKLWKFHL